MTAAAEMLVDGRAAFVEEGEPPDVREPEPEPEPEGAAEDEGVPPGAELIPTNSLPARTYSGDVVTVMYHGTDARAAQLIATSQQVLPSSQGLLGAGICITHNRQKAEGYHIHPPNASSVAHTTSELHVNLPLRSGDPDPGCILRFQVLLGT